MGVNLKENLKATLNPITGGARCRVFVANNSVHRKVLIVADEPAIKNLLILVRKMDSRRVATAGAGPHLSTLHRNSFDTAILDMRYSQRRPAGRGYGFGEVWPNMVGRVLVINAEVNDLKTLETAERYIYHRHSLKGLLLDLASLVRTFIGHSLAPRRI